MKFSVLCVAAVALGALSSPASAAFHANGGGHLPSSYTPLRKSAVSMSTDGYLQSLSKKSKKLTFSSQRSATGPPGYDDEAEDINTADNVMTPIPVFGRPRPNTSYSYMSPGSQRMGQAMELAAKGSESPVVDDTTTAAGQEEDITIPEPVQEEAVATTWEDFSEPIVEEEISNVEFVQEEDVAATTFEDFSEETILEAPEPPVTTTPAPIKKKVGTYSPSKKTFAPITNKAVGGYTANLEQPTTTAAKKVLAASHSDPIQAEKTIRGLLATRLEMEAKSRAQQALKPDTTVPAGTKVEEAAESSTNTVMSEPDVAQDYTATTIDSSPKTTTTPPKSGAYSASKKTFPKTKNAFDGYNANLGQPVEKTAAEPTSTSESFAETNSAIETNVEEAVDSVADSEPVPIETEVVAEAASLDQPDIEEAVVSFTDFEPVPAGKTQAPEPATPESVAETASLVQLEIEEEVVSVTDFEVVQAPELVVLEAVAETANLAQPDIEEAVVSFADSESVPAETVKAPELVVPEPVAETASSTQPGIEEAVVSLTDSEPGPAETVQAPELAVPEPEAETAISTQPDIEEAVVSFANSELATIAVSEPVSAERVQAPELAVPGKQTPFFASENSKTVKDYSASSSEPLTPRPPAEAPVNWINGGAIEMPTWEQAFKSIEENVSKLVEPFKQLFLKDGSAEWIAPEEEDENEEKLDTVGMTKRIMKKIPIEGQASGAGGASTWDAFKRMEENWSKVKAFEPFTYDSKLLRKDQNGIPPPSQFVTEDGASGNPKCWAKLREQQNKELDYDIVICGGTLGIFFATALQMKGHKVCVLEAGKLQGREQEWNISMDELLELLGLGVLTEEDIDAAITTEFPACRAGFKNREVTPTKGGYFTNGVGYECETPDVLNLGVAPAVLLERVGKRFKELGGVIKEDTRLQGVVVSESVGTGIDLGEENEPITARLVLDCMGNGSPISRQQRYGMKPDGICAVVGSCAAGFDKETNLIGDIIYTNTEMQDKGENGMMQYFWEAFPVGIGRDGKEPGTSDVKTTYMFTYMDADKNRPTIETLMEDYWRLLPKYQTSITNPETDLDVKRVLSAFFPTYRDSPLAPQWSRVLAVGDASGIQSPLSFGGFGALTRHLERVSGAISEALDDDCLHKDDLAEVNAYTPNLSAAWMFQKAMSVRPGQKVDPKFINRLLATNFEVMEKMGMRTIKPFLQDVIRIDGLVGSLAKSFVADPTFMPQIVSHVGIPTLVEWIGHVGMMGAYGVLDTVVTPIATPIVDRFEDRRSRFQWRRRFESWRYGSGNDYQLPEEN
jgi:flavin-dependent dehydrogenase